MKNLIKLLPMLLFTSCNPDLGMKSLTLYEYCGHVGEKPYESFTTFGATKNDVEGAIKIAQASRCQIVILTAEKASWFPKTDTLYKKQPNVYKTLINNR